MVDEIFIKNLSELMSLSYGDFLDCSCTEKCNEKVGKEILNIMLNGMLSNMNETFIYRSYAGNANVYKRSKDFYEDNASKLDFYFKEILEVIKPRIGDFLSIVDPNSIVPVVLNARVTLALNVFGPSIGELADKNKTKIKRSI